MLARRSHSSHAGRLGRELFGVSVSHLNRTSSDYGLGDRRGRDSRRETGLHAETPERVRSGSVMP